MNTEKQKQNQESWKEITLLGIASVIMLVILYFSVRMTMRLAEPLNTVKYLEWTAMRVDKMQKRIDEMDERIRKLEGNGKKMTFSSDGIMYRYGIIQGVETRESSGIVTEPQVTEPQDMADEMRKKLEERYGDRP